MNNLLRTFLFLTLGICLTSCMVGPDFEEPQIELPNEFENTHKEKYQIEKLSQWWEIFRDEQLNSLIVRALESNLDLAQARANIAVSRAALGSSQSGLWPTLDANANVTEKSQNGFGNPSTMYGLGLSAGWEIDIFGGIRRDNEATLADYKASMAEEYSLQIMIIAEVAKNYFTYRAYQEALSITKNNLVTQEKTYNITQQRKQSGFVSQLDVVRAAAQMKSTLSQIPSIEKSLAQTRYALELLLGLSSGSLKDELSEEKEFPELEFFAPIGVPAELVSRRPDVMAASYRMHSASARIGVATADLYPRLSITGTIGYQAPKLGSMVESQYGSWAIGPSVNWDIFRAGKILYNIEGREAALEAAGAYWKKTVLTALKEVEDNLIATNKERERVKYLNALSEHYHKAYELSFKLYSEGEIEFLDLLESQRSLLSAEQSVISSREAFLSNIISLYKALGGGWQPTDAEEME